MKRASRHAEVSVSRRTVNGRRFYPWHSIERVVARFSKTRNHVYLPDGTVLKRAKGRGYFECTKTGDIYGVMLVESRKKA